MASYKLSKTNAAGLMASSPTLMTDAGSVDSQGRPISRQEDDPGFDKDGRRQLNTSDKSNPPAPTTSENKGDRLANIQNLITKVASGPKGVLAPKPTKADPNFIKPLN